MGMRRFRADVALQLVPGPHRQRSSEARSTPGAIIPAAIKIWPCWTRDDGSVAYCWMSTTTGPGVGSEARWHGLASRGWRRARFCGFARLETSESQSCGLRQLAPT